jgi:hypothetical protein
LETLELKAQKGGASAPGDDRPELLVINCIYCHGRLRIYQRAIDEERTYARACLAVRLWVTSHNHCSPIKQIPGMWLYLR